MLKEKRALYSFLIILGFLSLSYEIFAFRLFTPFYGADLKQTSFIIGTVLLFLSLGSYFCRNCKDPLKKIENNIFLILPFLSVFLTHTFILYFDRFLGAKLSLSLAYRSFIITFLVLSPISYLYGQFIPLIIDLKSNIGSAKIIALSTFGSFVGALGTSLLLTYHLSLSEVTLLNVLLLFALSLFFVKKSLKKIILIALPFVLLSFYINFVSNKMFFQAETGVSTYKVIKSKNTKALVINNNFYSSILIDGKRTAEYHEYIQENILTTKTKQEVLILGAGGFTSSLRNQHHSYDYVDIDPKLKSIVKKYYHSNIVGRYISQDARAYLNESEKKYNLIMMDIVGHKSLSIPKHLLTFEYFNHIKKDLKENALFAINIVHHGLLFESEYGQSLTQTLQKVFGTCYYMPIGNRSMSTGSGIYKNSLGICQKNNIKSYIPSDNKY